MVIRSQTEIEYPSSDGNPMAENTLQFQWITIIKGGLDAIFRHDPKVFIAGDLLWYPVEEEWEIRAAPDAMVVFGRPKGHRSSYLQWEEENLPPQVVFEVLSPGNKKPEMVRKHDFYETYGVEEYYIYDPDKIKLEGWKRQGSVLRKIQQIQEGWTSPQLNVRFEMREELVLIGPDGRPFVDYQVLAEQRDQSGEMAKAEGQRADAEKQRADAEKQRAESERQKAEIEKQRAEAEKQRAEAERQRAMQIQSELDRLREMLRQRGIDPDTLS